MRQGLLFGQALLLRVIQYISVLSNFPRVASSYGQVVPSTQGTSLFINSCLPASPGHRIECRRRPDPRLALGGWPSWPVRVECGACGVADAERKANKGGRFPQRIVAPMWVVD